MSDFNMFHHQRMHFWLHDKAEFITSSGKDPAGCYGPEIRLLVKAPVVDTVEQCLYLTMNVEQAQEIIGKLQEEIEKLKNSDEDELDFLGDF